MAPGVCFTSPATPSLPLPPTPAGQFTDVPTPTFFLPFRRHLRQVVDPDVGRAGAVRAVNDGDVGVGKGQPGFSFAIAGSFHFVILPRKMSASIGPVNFSSAVTPGRL